MLKFWCPIRVRSTLEGLHDDYKKSECDAIAPARCFVGRRRALGTLACLPSL